MTAISIPDIDARLQHLPPEKLMVVFDFVSFLLEREKTGTSSSEAMLTAVASEDVLSRDWSSIEEDRAWADL